MCCYVTLFVYRAYLFILFRKKERERERESERERETDRQRAADIQIERIIK